jgi:hypothetical protein
MHQLPVTAKVVPSLPILVTLMMEALCSSEKSVLKGPHGITSQKTAFFMYLLMLLIIPATFFCHYESSFCFLSQHCRKLKHASNELDSMYVKY